MLWLRWAFIILNVVWCIGTILWSFTAKNAFGRRAITTPTTWVYVWQLIGVGIVIWGGFSALHLIWWFILGIILLAVAVRVLTRMGLTVPD